MVDETKSSVEPPKPGEYRFSSDEYDKNANAYGASQDDGDGESGCRFPKFQLPTKMNKKVLIIVGVIVLFFIAYQFVTPSKPKTPSMPTATQKVPATTVSDGRVTNLLQQVNVNADAIAKLQGQLTQTQAVLTNMESVLNSIDAKVQKLSSDVTILTTRRSVRRVRSVHKMRLPSVRYHVMAIVPGRAWLRSSHGLIITVRPGERIPHYGVVRRINPDRGLVTTSYGFTIKYGQYDI